MKDIIKLPATIDSVLFVIHQNLMEKFAECVQDSEQLKSALLEMQVQYGKYRLWQLTDSHAFDNEPSFPA